MFIQPVTHIEVEDTISSFDLTKSIGPNSIPVNLLKTLGHYISQPFAKLINQSFATGIFPSKLKAAKVVLYSKKETQNLLQIINLFLYFLFLVNYLRN